MATFLTKMWLYWPYFIWRMKWNPTQMLNSALYTKMKIMLEYTKVHIENVFFTAGRGTSEDSYYHYHEKYI